MGTLKGTSEGSGIQSLTVDVGIPANLSGKTYSSAASGIRRRTGLGRTRHLAVHQLCVQARLRNGDIRLFDYPGSFNAGDLLTKNVTAGQANTHIMNFGIAFHSGLAQ